MGMSYGVAICLQGKFKVSQLKPLVEAGLEELEDEGVNLSVSHGSGHTILAQGDGDHDRLWNASSVFTRLASTLAKALECRAWSIVGFAGTANHLVIEQYESDGKREWANRHKAAMRQFMKEAGFGIEPFDAFIKPFLELDRDLWKQVGSLEVCGEAKLREVSGAELERLLGRSLPGRKAWVDEGPEVVSVLLELKAPKSNVETLGLRECAFNVPSFIEQSRDELVLLPGGRSVRGYANSVSGLVSTRKGKTVTLRWGHTLSDGNSNWLCVFVAEGPFVEEYKLQERARLEAEAEAEAEAGLEKNDSKRVLKAIKAGGLDLESWAERAGTEEKWQCFESLVAKLPAKAAKHVRNGLLRSLPWREAIKHGADVNSRDELESTPLHQEIEDLKQVKALLALGARLDLANYEGNTPLHLAEDPAVARLLIEAGAPLDVKDNNGRTPLARFLRPLSFSTPSAADLGVVAMMVKRRAPPSGKALLSLLAPWKSKPTHQAAYKQLTQLIT